MSVWVKVAVAAALWAAGTLGILFWLFAEAEAVCAQRGYPSGRWDSDAGRVVCWMEQELPK